MADCRKCRHRAGPMSCTRPELLGPMQDITDRYPHNEGGNCRYWQSDYSTYWAVAFWIGLWTLGFVAGRLSDG